MALIGPVRKVIEVEPLVDPVPHPTPPVPPEEVEKEVESEPVPSKQTGKFIIHGSISGRMSYSKSFHVEVDRLE